MNRNNILKKILTGLLLVFFLSYNYYLSSNSNLDQFSESLLLSDNIFSEGLTEISRKIGFQFENPKPRDIVGRLVRGMNVFFNIIFAFLFTKAMSNERKILVGGLFTAFVGAAVLLLLKKLTGNMVFHEQGGRIIQVVSAPFLFLLMFPFIKLIQKLAGAEKSMDD